MDGRGDQTARVLPVAEWGWPGDLGKDDLNAIAPVSLELWLRGADWVNRRVESVDLLDANAVRMRLSVDFRIPQRLPGQRSLGGKSTYFLPITAMPRNGSLSYFDARDESGSGIPILTRDENTQLTSLMLVAAAKRAIAKAHRTLTLSPEMTRRLSLIPMASRTSMKRRLQALFGPAGRTEEEKDAEDILLKDRDFLDLLGICTFCCFIHAPITANAGERRIVKLAWTAPWDSEVSQRWYEGLHRRLWSWLGWRTHVRYLLVHHAGSARSYHAQIQAPERVDLTAAGLSVNRPADLIQAWFKANDASRPDLPERQEGDLLRRTVPGIAQRKHLYVGRAEHHRSGALWVRLRPSRHGFLRPATAVAGFVSAVLFVFAERTANVLGDAQTGAAILLIVPALIAGFLVVPGEHEMTRHLLRGPRLLTGLAGFIALAAVTSMVVVPEKGSAETVDALATIWRTEGILAGVLAAVLVVSWLAPGARLFHWNLFRWRKKLPRRALVGRAKDSREEGNS